MLLAQEAASGTAVVTAIGGVIVSLTTVYLNSRKQVNTTDALQIELDTLRKEVDRLRKEVEAREAIRVERDMLMEICQVYGGRRVKKRLLDIDLRRHDA